MASLQEIKNRLGSVSTTKKITKAMQLVATAKLRRAKTNFDGIQEYCTTIEDTFKDLFKSVKDFSEIVLPTASKKTLYVLVTSDIGLCGAYNSNVIKLLKQQVKHGDELIAIGTKGVSHFKTRHKPILEFDHVGDKIDYAMPSEIAKVAVAKFLTGEIKSIKVVYTKFINSVTFNAETLKVLPIEVDKDKPKQQNLTEFEPDAKTVLKNAIPLYVSSVLYKLILESKVSEMSSRRMAMENATDNADDLIDKLYLQYNRARQAKITQEISEIIAGSEER